MAATFAVTGTAPDGTAIEGQTSWNGDIATAPHAIFVRSEYGIHSALIPAAGAKITNHTCWGAPSYFITMINAHRPAT